MAKRIIEFDDGELGCTNCPYCRKDNCLNSKVDSSEYRFGYFCSKMNPWKWIAFGYENSKKKITIPKWCELKEFTPPEPEIKTISIPKIQFIPAHKLPMEKLVTQIQVNTYLQKEISSDKLKSILIEQLANNISRSKEFQDNIKYSQVTNPIDNNITVRGEINIIKNNCLWPNI